MTCDWPTTTLSRIAKLRSGFPFKSSDWQERGVPVIKIANVKSGRIKADGCGYVSGDVAASVPEWLTQDGDVLIAMTGYVGEVALVRPRERYLINQRVGRFEFRPDSPVRPGFLFYYLQVPAVRASIEEMARGSAQPNLSATDAAGLQVPVPPSDVQAAVEELGRSIDDRIDNLRATNATLEAIAQALFKSWFVDFDPVHAKAEGRAPEGMDAATAALFPSEFEDSELGPVPVPKGWRVRRLGDICRLNWGNTSMTKKSYVEEGFKAFSAAGQDGLVEVGERSGIGSVISAIGTVGIVHLAFGRWTAIKNTLTAQCDTDIDSAWLHFLLKTVHFPARGSTQQFISQTDARGVQVIAPPSEIRQQYGSFCVELITRMEAAQDHVDSLVDLRDTLLPRLISGKLRLPEARELAEAEA